LVGDVTGGLRVQVADALRAEEGGDAGLLVGDALRVRLLRDQGRERGAAGREGGVAGVLADLRLSRRTARGVGSLDRAELRAELLRELRAATGEGLLDGCVDGGLLVLRGVEAGGVDAGQLVQVVPEVAREAAVGVRGGGGAVVDRVGDLLDDRCELGLDDLRRLRVDVRRRRRRRDRGRATTRGDPGVFTGWIGGAFRTAGAGPPPRPTNAEGLPVASPRPISAVGLP
jgi:hypothetical protein